MVLARRRARPLPAAGFMKSGMGRFCITGSPEALVSRCYNAHQSCTKLPVSINVRT
jgi:hypothetical protein